MAALCAARVPSSRRLRIRADGYKVARDQSSALPPCCADPEKRSPGPLQSVPVRQAGAAGEACRGRSACGPSVRVLGDRARPLAGGEAQRPTRTHPVRAGGQASASWERGGLRPRGLLLVLLRGRLLGGLRAGALL